MAQLEEVFVCTRCKGALARETAGLVCRACRETYAVAGGIPILIPHDQMPGNGYSEAIRKAEYLSGVPGDFARMVDEYYDCCVRGGCPDEVFEYYRRCTRARRVADCSEELGFMSLALQMFGCGFPPVRRAVELGSGWGFSLAALARARATVPALRDAVVCGFDVNPPVLAVARRLFAELGLENVFVAVADARLPLPFPARSVDLLYSNGVVEHILEQDVLMRNMSDAMSDDAVMHFMIPNRYMIHPEPHYNVRWVGFVPRRYLRRYVGWRLGMKSRDVEYILSYSPRDLARLMGKHFPKDLLAAIPVRPRLQGRVVRALADHVLGLTAANGYHCVVRRTPLASGGDPRRGQLWLSECALGPHVQCARVYRAAA